MMHVYVHCAALPLYIVPLVLLHTAAYNEAQFVVPLGLPPPPFVNSPFHRSQPLRPASPIMPLAPSGLAAIANQPVQLKNELLANLNKYSRSSEDVLVPLGNSPGLIDADSSLFADLHRQPSVVSTKHRDVSFVGINLE